LENNWWLLWTVNGRDVRQEDPPFAFCFMFWFPVEKSFVFFVCVGFGSSMCHLPMRSVFGGGGCVWCSIIISVNVSVLGLPHHPAPSGTTTVGVLNHC
jgi:hypothetical protein